MIKKNYPCNTTFFKQICVLLPSLLCCMLNRVTPDRINITMTTCNDHGTGVLFKTFKDWAPIRIIFSYAIFDWNESQWTDKMGEYQFSGTDNGHKTPCDVAIGSCSTSVFMGSLHCLPHALIRFTLETQYYSTVNWNWVDHKGDATRKTAMQQ